MGINLTEMKVNARDMAEMLGLSPRAVQGLAQKGILPHEKQGREYRFHLGKSVQAYIRYLDETRKRKEPGPLKIRKLQAEVRIRESRANIAEKRELALESRLIDAGTVRDYMEWWAGSVRYRLLELPEQLAGELSREEDPGACHEIIKRYCREVLQDLSGLSYSESRNTKVD